MSQYLVAVIDGTKARFLTLSPVEFDGYESGPNLIEYESLYSAEKDMQGQDLWANTKTGRNRGTAGQAHSYDDHRENHMVEFERRFTQKIVNQILDLSTSHEVQQLILVAEPQMLGIMREMMVSGLPKRLIVHEVGKDLCRMTAKELHDYLAERSLLPAFKRAGV
ncbi:host attachment protein [Vacuolonema iberomarrocanum]|uniref:host attachment protein n=1 Tax=Vacuolonema iberomarrocanum TaxID=3454632 RepID=UPI0019F46D3B|nr:host attachment protein [filamentous cyanobacterium LEGE 07170]